MWLPGPAAIGSSPTDTDDERLQKRLLIASTLMMASLAVVWGGLYLGFGEPVAASIPLVYAVASFASLAVFARVRGYALFRASQLVLSLLLPFLLMLALGGFVASSAVVLWSLTCPLGALVFAGRRTATGWFVAYVGLVILAAFIAPGLDSDLPDSFVTTFFVLNLTGVSVVAFVLLQYFVGERDLALTVLDRERRWIRDAFSSYISPNLVRHLIEHPDELRLGGERRDCTFVLSDLAGFTELVERVDPERVVKLLERPWSGLPTGLTVESASGEGDAGLSYLGIAVQSIVAEARLLAQPVSFELVSTAHAEGIEDRMTMSPLAARRLSEMVELARLVVATELVVSAQAVELRGSAPLGNGTREILASVRERYPFLENGDLAANDLDPVVDLVASGRL